MSKSWSVTVEANGEQIVTIGHNHLSGKDLTAEDEEAIRNAARHLLSFVGEGSSVSIPHDEPYLAPTSLGVVIRKRGYFYRPEWCGYTASIHEAGRYDREAAERHAAVTEGVTVHEITEFANQ